MFKNLNISNYLEYLLIVFFSFLVNYYYSSLGVLAQDTFAYYDTAFRILNGSAPFKDYWTVSGPFIDYLQAIFFYFFDVSWKSYIISGSIINASITSLFFYILKNFKLEKVYCIFYALCFSILANPSMGVPFPDHYSTFFSLAGIFFFLIAIKKENKKIWFCIPIFLFIGFLSKQSPSSYILLVLLFSITIYIYLSKNFLFIKHLIISSLFCFLSLFLFFYLNKIDLNQFLYQYFLFPKTIALERMQDYEITFNGIFLQFKFIYLFLLPLIIVTFKLINKKLENKYDNFLYCLILILTSFVLIFHQIITKNFIFIFFLIPMLASLLQISLIDSTKYKKAIIIFLISSTFLLTLKYHVRFNENRKMLNLENINLKNTESAGLIHPSLKGLKWITYEYEKDPLEEILLIKENLKIVKRDKTKKMLISRYLFMSSITGENLNNPSRWPSMQDASNPNKNNQYHETYKNFILNLISLKKIQTLYTSESPQNDIFLSLFDNNCRKTKVINDFLTKHDIKNCIN